MKKPFIHLHNHSHYSLLDGLSKIPEIISMAKEYGMPAVALTDHGNMHGALEFYNTCKKEGIKPIIGVEAYMSERSRFDKEHGIDNRRYHLTLLAKNKEGYKNLMKMVTASNLEGYYYKPRMDMDLLSNHSEGLICLSGCPGGRLSKALAADDQKEGEKIVKEHLDIFGKENYFLEIMAHKEIEGYENIKKGILELSEKFDLPIVATHDAHYPKKEDKTAHETLLAVNTGDNKKTGLSFGNQTFSFISPDEAYDLFSDIPEAVTNTQKVADMVDIDLELGDWVFPDYELPERETYDNLLKTQAYKGLENRKIKLTEEVKERIEYELKVIKDKGFSPYFIIVGDLMRFAKEQGILSTIRGSVAGSLVTYLLGITSIDPLEYDLPFERFLNPQRPSAPDIDMDFADDRRDEVLQYAKEKYGEDKVAQIGTFGTMMARGAVRDVARALGYPYNTGDKLAKLIPFGSQGFPMTINKAIEETPELKELYENEKDAGEIIDIAKRLEGCARHVSVHAAGVVISPTRLDDYVPLQTDSKSGKIITQYDMHAVEEAGLIKFDFLGIRNLSILGDAVKIVKKLHNIDIDLDHLPLDDKKTFELLSKGQTMGVFQLSSSGMQRYLKELKPTTIHDINAMIALYRPGPMANIPEYIERKHGKKPITYYHPKMKKFLEKSFGILVYQDDLIFTALEMAGYDWGSVDKLRKAVGKKLPEEMKRQHKIFVDGCMKYSNMSKKEAEGLWQLFEPFQGYGFNKAHAACYGEISYQTAYMKANFPVEYMTAILTAESGDIEKISEIIYEANKMDIKVLPPNINESFGGFTVAADPENKEKQSIRFGLYTIKNLGYDISDTIIEERKKQGPFKNFADLIERVQSKNLNKTSLESLIKSGALDDLEERGQLLANLEEILEYKKELNKSDASQGSLFGSLDQGTQLRLKEAPPAEKEVRLSWEKDLLGLYVSGHPLDQYQKKIKEKGIPTLKNIKTQAKAGQNVSVVALIENIKEVTTKKGQKMAFVRITDKTDSIETVVFPDAFEKLNEILKIEQILAIQAKISDRDGQTSLLLEKAKTV